MVYRTSNSVAALVALLAGCSGLMGPVANAGDRIEFSAPSPLLEVPHPDHTVKLDAVADIRGSFSKHQSVGADAAYSPATTIIIPAQKSQDHFGWTAPFEEDKDQADPSGLNLFAAKKTTSQTKDASISNDTDDKDFGFSKDENWTKSDRDLGQLGTDSVRRNGEGDNDRLGSRLDDHGASDWFKTLNSHAAVSERTAREELTPRKEGNEEVSAFYQRSFGGFSQVNPLGPTDPLHTSAYVASDSGKDVLDESLRGPSERLLLTQPSLPQAWDALPSAAHPQRPQTREQAYSAASRAPSAPAVLPFPKRPGALFQ